MAMPTTSVSPVHTAVSQQVQLVQHKTAGPVSPLPDSCLPGHTSQCLTPWFHGSGLFLTRLLGLPPGKISAFCPWPIFKPLISWFLFTSFWLISCCYFCCCLHCVVISLQPTPACLYHMSASVALNCLSFWVSGTQNFSIAAKTG